MTIPISIKNTKSLAEEAQDTEDDAKQLFVRAAALYLKAAKEEHYGPTRETFYLRAADCLDKGQP